MAIADEQGAYQQQLEHVRTVFGSPFFDDDDRDQALEDLQKAKVALEVAWLQEIGVTTSDDGGNW